MHVTARTNRTEQGTSGRTETGRGSLVKPGKGLLVNPGKCAPGRIWKRLLEDPGNEFPGKSWKRLLVNPGNRSWKILEDATGRSWKRGSWKMMGFPVPGTPRNWGFQSLGVSES